MSTWIENFISVKRLTTGCLFVLVLKVEPDMNRNAIWAFSPSFATDIQFSALKSTGSLGAHLCPPYMSQSVPSDGSNPFSVFFSHRSEVWGPSTQWALMQWGSSAQRCLEEARKHHHSSYQSKEHVKITAWCQNWPDLSPLVSVGSLGISGL